jgi:hypothetical protein
MYECEGLWRHMQLCAISISTWGLRAALGMFTARTPLGVPASLRTRLSLVLLWQHSDACHVNAQGTWLRAYWALPPLCSGRQQWHEGARLSSLTCGSRAVPLHYLVLSQPIFPSAQRSKQIRLCFPDLDSGDQGRMH